MKKQPSPPSTKAWQRALIAFALGIAILGGLDLVLELQWRGGYNVVYNEVEKIRNDIIEPAGGVATPGGDLRGSTFWDWGKCIDVSCPMVAKGWSVPIEVGKEKEFIQDIFKREGYSAGWGDYFSCTREPDVSCDATARKGNLQLSISAGSTNDPPSRDVSPKVWRGVSVTVTPLHIGQPLP